MLSTRYSKDDIRRMLVKKEDFHPFPTCSERAEWEAVPTDVKEAWISAAEEYLHYNWPAITAEMYLTIKLTGELKWHWEAFRTRRAALGFLVMAECLEGKGRFTLDIINGLQVICEETSWLQGLNIRDFGYDLLRASDHLVDLCSSETASLLAFADYLLRPQIEEYTHRILPRVKAEIDARIIRPYLDKDDYWWMGFTKDRINNWNPWCNMNVLMCLMLIDIDTETRVNAIHRCLESLDAYINTYAPDGCCDEGPGYWGAAGAGLYICLKLLSDATNGGIDGMSEPLVGDIGRYITHVHIANPYFVSYADGDAKINQNAITYLFGKALNDEGMMAMGANAPSMGPTTGNWFFTYQHLADMLSEKERRACALKPAYPQDHWFFHTEVLTAREKGGSPDGWYLSAKGGSNIESHNHNDVGNFIAFLDGNPVLIDLGTEEYSAKTFSPERYEIWYTQSQYHNCPGVNAVLQHDGREYRTASAEYFSDENCTSLTMDIAPAYPKEAGIITWKRCVALNRGNKPCITVQDVYELESPSEDIERFFMTPCKPTLQDSDILLDVHPGLKAVLRYDADTSVAAIEEIPLTESRLIRNWGEIMYRIVLREKAKSQKGECKISLFRA